MRMSRIKSHIRKPSVHMYIYISTTPRPRRVRRIALNLCARSLRNFSRVRRGARICADDYIRGVRLRLFPAEGWPETATTKEQGQARSCVCVCVCMCVYVCVCVCVYVCVCLPTRTCVMVGRSEVRRQSTDSYKKNKCWEKNYVHITALKTRSATKGPRGLLFSVRFNWKFQSLKICHRLYAYIIYIRYTCCYMCYYSVYI